MSDYGLGLLLWIALFLVLGLMMGLKLGEKFTIDDWREQAVKHGAATYYLDENNNKRWRWNNESEKTK